MPPSRGQADAGVAASLVTPAAAQSSRSISSRKIFVSALTAPGSVGKHAPQSLGHGDHPLPHGHRGNRPRDSAHPRTELHVSCQIRKAHESGRSAPALERFAPVGGAIRPSGWSDSPQWVERIAPPTRGFNGREEASRTNEKSFPKPKYVVMRFFKKNRCDWHRTCMFFVESNLDSLPAEV